MQSPAGSDVPTYLSAPQSTQRNGPFDVIVTDPPYYDAIPYSDLMDFFYVWLRRRLSGVIAECRCAVPRALGPKWNHEQSDGELVDDAAVTTATTPSRRRPTRREWPEPFKHLLTIHAKGRFVIVFAHKQPDAWETLVVAIIRAGFVVDGSWPIQTEMGNRTRACQFCCTRFVRLACL